MRRRIFGALVFLLASGTAVLAFAMYSVSDEGLWPANWPTELESLRKQARTLEGPLGAYLHYAIRFQSREEFESAWPHLLKLKSAGAPMFLVRGKNFFLGEGKQAGIVIHCPPDEAEQRLHGPARTIENHSSPRTRWMNATTIELVVDGDVVDLNRIPLPADTPIVDERFEKE